MTIIELSEHPACIVVNGARAALNGYYRRQFRSSRGMPCYAKAVTSEFPEHIFLYYKNRFWRVGPTFGSDDCIMMAKDPSPLAVGGRGMLPLEPYPHGWYRADGGAREEAEAGRFYESEKLIGVRAYGYDGTAV